MIEGRNMIKIDGVEMSIEFIAMLLKTLDGALIKDSEGRVIFSKRSGDGYIFRVIQS